MSCHVGVWDIVSGYPTEISDGQIVIKIEAEAAGIFACQTEDPFERFNPQLVEFVRHLYDTENTNKTRPKNFSFANSSNFALGTNEGLTGGPWCNLGRCCRI